MKATVAALGENDRSAVRAHAIRLLGRLASNSKLVNQFVELKAFDLVQKSAGPNIGANDTGLATVQLIFNLTLTEIGFKVASQPAAVELLFDAMRSHLDSALVQQVSCNTIEKLAGPCELWSSSEVWSVVNSGC